MNNLQIRHAVWDDLSSIIDIYNQAIRARNATGFLSDLKLEERERWFSAFHPDTYPIYVAIQQNVVMGFIFLSHYRAGREAMKHIAEISFFVDQRFHRQGIGTQLMSFMLEECKRIGKKSLVAFLLDINQPSIRLLEKFNFEKWGLLPRVLDFPSAKHSHLIMGLNL